MQIKITEEHIKNGVRKDISQCPIALALFDIGCHDICVSDLELVFNKSTDGEWWTYDIFPSRLPQYRKYLAFLENFDGGYNVKPFTLNIPDDILENSKY